jgi:Domain of Unknown Function (DUF1080)
MKLCSSFTAAKSLLLFACGSVAALLVVGFGHTSGSTTFQDKRFDDGIVWPEPKAVTAGNNDHEPPSDAIILFDGKNFDAWKGAQKWKIDPDGGTTAASLITTKQAFGDCQLHVEWASPKVVKGSGQGRGNNGIGFMQGKYEIQVLDSYNNPTYFVGQAAAVYNQRPPMVNASRKPGEWQSYDIVFEAPRFDKDGKLVRPAYATVFHNGVLVQNHTEIKGTTHYDQPYAYTAHAEKLPLQLLYHNNPVRFRNIWIREFAELKGKKKR